MSEQVEGKAGLDAPIVRARVGSRFFIYGDLYDIFVDAGAQVGWHTLNVASAEPNSPVIAIELEQPRSGGGSTA